MNLLSLLFVLIPLAVASLGAGLKSVALMALTIPVLFLLVKFLPFCRHRENLWMFTFTAISVIPINCYVIRKMDLLVYFNGSMVKCFLWSVLVFFILLAVEEIVLGLITRLIWRRQYKLPVFDDD